MEKYKQFSLIRLDAKVSPGMNIITVGLSLAEGTLLRTYVTSGGYGALSVLDIHDTYIPVPFAKVYEDLCNVESNDTRELRRKLNLTQVVKGEVSDDRSAAKSGVDGKDSTNVTGAVRVKPVTTKSTTKPKPESNGEPTSDESGPGGFNSVKPGK